MVKRIATSKRMARLLVPLTRRRKVNGCLKMRNCWLPLLVAALFVAVMVPGLSQAANLNVPSVSYPDGYVQSGDASYTYGTIGNLSGSGTYNDQEYSVTFTGHVPLTTTGLAVGALGHSGTLNLNTAGPGTGSITVSYDEVVGALANGTFNQGGGTNTVDGSLYLGVIIGVTGTYNLSGGSLSATDEYVGTTLGTGIFNQTGGTNTVSNNLYIGYLGGSGTYNLSGGNLDPVNEYVGYTGTGTFNQTGGTNTVSNNLYLGYLGGNGTYNLSGGKLKVYGDEYVGSALSTGTFNQTGGMNKVDGSLYLGYAMGANGTYNLSGGKLKVEGDEYVGIAMSTGTFNQTGGMNKVEGSLYLGYAMGGTGTFNQTGGMNKVDGSLYLGYAMGGTGTYNLSGGSLSARNEYIGYSGTGTFNQTGGTNKVRYMEVADGTGTYNLSGGSLYARTIDLNEGGTFYQNPMGTDLEARHFNQQGGTVTGSLQVYDHGVFNYFSGDFSGSLRNSGTVNIIGLWPNQGATLYIGGDYTQYYTGHRTGLLNIRIFAAPDNWGGIYNDQIIVTGMASLAGYVNPILENGYLPRGNTIFPIITASSISGSLMPAYSQLPNSHTLFWTTEVASDPTFDLVVTRNYTDPGLNLNFKQLGVGTMLNGLAGTATGDLDNVLNVIDYLPTAGAVGNALQQISPDKVQVLSDLSFTAVRAETQSLARRMTNLRYGIDDMGGAGGAGSYNLEGCSVFLDPTGFLGSRSTTMDRTGYNFDGAGFIMGIDRKVADNLLVGLAAGYTHADASFSNSGGSADVDVVPISIYGAYMPNDFYIFGTAGYARNLYDLKRQISFSEPDSGPGMDQPLLRIPRRLEFSGR